MSVLDDLTCDVGGINTVRPAGAACLRFSGRTATCQPLKSCKSCKSLVVPHPWPTKIHGPRGKEPLEMVVVSISVSDKEMNEGVSHPAKNWWILKEIPDCVLTCFNHPTVYNKLPAQCWIPNMFPFAIHNVGMMHAMAENGVITLTNFASWKIGMCVSTASWLYSTYSHK